MFLFLQLTERLAQLTSSAASESWFNNAASCQRKEGSRFFFLLSLKLLMALEAQISTPVVHTAIKCHSKVANVLKTPVYLLNIYLFCN